MRALLKTEFAEGVDYPSLSLRYLSRAYARLQRAATSGLAEVTAPASEAHRASKEIETKMPLAEVALSV